MIFTSSFSRAILQTGTALLIPACQQVGCYSYLIPNTEAFLAIVGLNCAIHGLVTLFTTGCCIMVFRATEVVTPQGFVSSPYSQLPNTIYAERTDTSGYV